jgi:hypothetical protein
VQAHKTARQFDLAHVAQAVLVDPALHRIEQRDPFRAGDAGTVRAGGYSEPSARIRRCNESRTRSVVMPGP